MINPCCGGGGVNTDFFTEEDEQMPRGGCGRYLMTDDHIAPLITDFEAAG